MTLRAYQAAQKVTEQPRQTEYRLFAQVTRALIEAREKPRTDPAVIDAIHWNRRLWSTLMVDCSSDDNALPEALRAQIISLAMWVSRHSTDVMRGDEDMAPLIEINRNIMEGLAAITAAAAT